jgi:hypothetical protein
MNITATIFKSKDNKEMSTRRLNEDIFEDLRYFQTRLGNMCMHMKIEA